MRRDRSPKRSSNDGLAALLSAALAVAALLVALGPSAAQRPDPATQADYPLVGDDGQAIPNHRIKLPGPIDQVRGVVVVGNPIGRKMLAEFYDLNCPYCRLAAAGIGDMLDHDAELRIVLVPFPVLGAASIGASRVELAVAKLGTPRQFYAFHRQALSRRGTTDGPRALEIARGLGFDAEKLTTLGNSEEITRTMKDLVGLGDALGLLATPSFIVGGVAVLGYPGRGKLQALADAAGRCGRVLC